MTSYCPTCANLLLVDLVTVLDDDRQQLRYFCQTCPYIYNIDNKITRSLKTARKTQDDVLSTDAQNSTRPQTAVTCSKCNHDKAYFTEVQTRSADEAATLFFTCVKCGNKWREQ